MVVSTSGLTSFSLEVDGIINKAFQPLINEEFITAKDTQNGRLALNLILIELQNMNSPLNKLDTVNVTVVEDTFEYNLDASISDVIKLSLKDENDNEIPLTRSSLKEYHNITAKTQEGRPSTYTVERLSNNVVVKLWPIPNDDVYELVILASKRVEDITASYQKLDLPYRYIPLIIRWLSYELSLDNKGIDPQTRAELKQNYLETRESTFEEDRERTDFTITPASVSGF